MGLFDFLKPQVSSDNTAETTDCAWCLEEQGLLNPESQSEGDSHGICEPHSNQVLYNYHLGKFNRVPSYAERWQDGQFEEEEGTNSWLKRKRR